MRLYVDDNEKEQKMKISVKQDRENVHIVGNVEGRNYVLFILLPDGTFKKPGNIRKDLGIQTNMNGQIKETSFYE